MSGFSGEIGHLTGIESPWGPAGGVLKTLQDVEAMARTGVGWLEPGSYTLEKRLGNAVDPEHPELGEQYPVYHHNPITGETGNSLGMPNKGMDEVETEIPEMVKIAEKFGKRLIVNVAPVSNEPVEEARELVSRAYAAGAHAVLLNAGCPNVVSADGGRHELLSRNPLMLAKVLFALTPVVQRHHPIFLRISPQESYEKMVEVMWGVRHSQVVSAVFVPNTWPGFLPTDKASNPVPLGYQQGAGGLSGPAVAADAREQTAWTIAQVQEKAIDTVSSAGIMTAQELKRRLQLGAVAGAGTTFYRESGDWRHDTDQLLRDLAS